ncbi:iron-sulfur assembly protein IscA-like 2, mitochondrial [Alnus glutinosa]|uniref:iron-sulfur assembly protein IscA-like 2, mitochondrial n=1 Tax=Alnus glutinosa TaxID=3517 RepID=UPI002D7863F5|nr:iron-sulfur assembly protein IscA-like 2, mitochondrial [Alnus glutinosa]
MVRSAIKRLAPYLAGRIRENQRLLSSVSSSSVLHEDPPSSSYSSPSPSPSPSPSLDALQLTENCVRRMKELQAGEASDDEKMLRLTVETGGCSGFQYVFDLDGKTNSDDRVFEQEGVKVVVDNISYDFVKGATVDYVEELIRAAFMVTENPSAVGGCSCKSSFMVKQ